jgi:hypothetical protein
MRKKLSKSNIIIAQKGISLVVVFATLLTAFVAIAPWTYGWFAKNNTVTASGMHTQAYHPDFTVEYAFVTKGSNGDEIVGEFKDILKATETDLFKDIKAPGDSVTIQIKITSKSKYDVKLAGFGLEAPSTAQDVPKSDGTYNRYLSTELTTELIEINGETTSVNGSAPIYLRGTSLTDDTQMGTEEASQNPARTAGRIDYIGSFVKPVDDQTPPAVLLPKGGSVTFTIRLTFVNATYNQNIYKNFATTGGKCERTFFFTFEEDMSSSS